MSWLEFKSFIKSNKNKKFIIKVQGFIDLNLYSKITQVLINKEEVNLFDKKRNILKINKHQVMKIELIKDNTVKIKLHELLMIYIEK